ncbi:MAG: glycosyltransferase family 4 protein [Solirubrobacteraceae bacterium]|nr:glycosyltransferase family 4 protein [Solirubrobacteraceae bacterium]
MRVALDARGAGDVRGIGRYVRCLRDALVATAPEGSTIVERRRPVGCDAFHSPWIDGALLRPGRPQVVTLHDLVPLKRRAEYLRTGVRFRLRYAAVARADRIIVPTAAVADDVLRHLGVDGDRVRTIHEAPAPGFRPADDDAVAAVREELGLPDAFLLWVGGLRSRDPRKRVSELVAAPRTMPLVLVGPTGPWTAELTGGPEATGPAGGAGARGGRAGGDRGARGDGAAGIHLTGEVTDEQLTALYTAAHALVLASDDEGFGLTPLEALACGCPVACTDVPAVREVLGDHATFVDRDDLAGLVAAAEASSRPAPAAPAWTWEDAARATWAVYREIAA